MVEPIKFAKTSKKQGPVSITRPATDPKGLSPHGVDTKERATCWSITINNYTDEELELKLPGWKLWGQPEVGKKNGVLHFQGMLTTPQVRFSQVKRQFPRAHIQVARDRTALAKYVQKEDTRVGEYREDNGIPTLWEYQTIVADEWNNDIFQSRRDDDAYAKRFKYDSGSIALEYVDEICAKLIEGGAKGLEFVAINPMWRSAWKKFYASIIKRHGQTSVSISQGTRSTGEGEQQECGQEVQEQAWDNDVRQEGTGCDSEE